MTHSEKRQRTSSSDSIPNSQSQQQQQQQHPPMVALPPPLVPYHPHMIPMMSYPVYHPNAAHPQYYISVASPNSAPQPHVLETTGTAAGKSPPSIVATETPTTTTGPATMVSPRYERILPKRPSEATILSGSPSSSPLGPHPSPYAYSLQPSPLSLPQHPSYGHQLQPQQHSTADQREQARKISHSAIERRRREKINDKIMQLKSIIPACADQENLHKMSILQSAIDYIHYLKGVVDEKQQHDEGKQPPTISTTPPSNNTTSSSSSSLAPNQDHNHPPTPTTPSYGGHSSPTSSTTTLEPLKPIDIMNSNRQSPYHSSPPFSLVSPASLEKNSHMKLDHLLS